MNLDADLMPEIPSAPDAAALFATTAEGSSRFGLSGGNLLVCTPHPHTPERIAERRAYADQRLASTKRAARESVALKKSLKRLTHRGVRLWQSCVDRMKNGDVGMRAEWAMVFDEDMKELAKSIDAMRNFKDTEGERVFA